MTQQTVEQFGLDLDRIAKDLPEATKKKILLTCANYQLRAIRENFRNERDPDGSPWPPLSEVTLKVRGHSRRMLFGNSDPTQLVRSVPVDADTVAIGTNDPILGIHHTGAEMVVTPKQSVWMFHNLFGGEGPPGPFGMVGKTLRIPQRRGIGFSEADKREHEQIAARWMEKLFQGGGAAPESVGG